MADSSEGNGASILDAIAQTNLKVVGEAPTVAMAMVYQVAANTTAQTMNNATAVQGFTEILGFAATVKGVSLILK